MPKRSSNKLDINILASSIVERATTTVTSGVTMDFITDKNPNAVALGRLGGLKGGKARASKLTPGQRKEIAQRAAKARWSK